MGVILATAVLGTLMQVAAAESSRSSSAVSNLSTSAATAACPTQVQITLGAITLSGTVVTVNFTHTGPECGSATPTVLHVHENLLTEPKAGSDPNHQLNMDFPISRDSGNSVTVPLLDAVAGKCFVQVDAHASGKVKGVFFPTATCSTATPPPPSTSVNPPPPPPTTTAVNPPPPPTTSVVNPPTPQGFPAGNTGATASTSDTRNWGMVGIVLVGLASTALLALAFARHGEHQ